MSEQESSTTPTPAPTPSYLNKTFGVRPDDMVSMDAWINRKSVEGYRLFDRQAITQQGNTLRINVLMERDRPIPMAVVSNQEET